jgi:hypothetical protein
VPWGFRSLKLAGPLRQNVSKDGLGLTGLPGTGVY